MSLKILFLTPYPPSESPSQRFRFEQYRNLLSQEGHCTVQLSFLTPMNWRKFYKKRNHFQKVMAILKGFINRVLMLFQLPDYDFVFIHREATPVGPPIFEWLIAKIFKKNIVYDFDDAIWLTDRDFESRLFRLIKWRSKVASICQWSYAVSCGNDYLCNFARQFNKNVHFIPTTIDTVGVHNPTLHEKKPRPELIIGWTGSHSTLKYLAELTPVLIRIEAKFPEVTLWVICDHPPLLPGLPRVEFRPWSLETEIADLRQFDIGVMPLPDDQWAQGKCGFKALQYLAMGIPAVISPVGVNTQIVANGRGGYLASSHSEWYDALVTLIEDKLLRDSVGGLGQKEVEAQFSVNSNCARFFALFEKLRVNNNPTK